MMQVPPSQLNTIRIREYDSILIGESWDASANTISGIEAAAIERHMEETGRNLLTFGHKQLKSTNWVGTLAVGDKCIEVYPKIDSTDGSDPLGRARENLIHMVATAGYVPYTEAGLFPLLKSQKPIISAYMELYVDNLAREWRRGMIKEYVIKEENKTFLKGKLIFSEHFKSNLIRKDRFYTSCDEFIEDNYASRLLKSALLVCRSQKISEEVRRKAAGLIPDFESVASEYLPPEIVKQISVDRRHMRYEPVINLAKAILSMSSPDAPSDSAKVYSLMFDMNEVFERFVASELRRALSGSSYVVRFQVGGKSLLRKDGKARFNLNPDFGVFSGKEVVCLLDTKWKKLDLDKTHSNVSQSDMYQMYAYGKEYDSPLTILVYPRMDKLPEVVAEYYHHEDEINGLPRKISVATLNVSSDFSQLGNRIELRNTLKRLVGEQSSVNRNVN